MPAAEPRYGIAQVTEDSLAGWIAFCDAVNLDRNVFCEVLGVRLGEIDPAKLPPFLERAVRDARALRNQRRRRGPGGDSS